MHVRLMFVVLLCSGLEMFGAADSKEESCEDSQQMALIKAFIEKHKSNPPKGKDLLTIGRAYDGTYVVAYLMNNQKRSISEAFSDTLEIKMGSLDALDDVPIFGFVKDLSLLDDSYVVSAFLMYCGRKKFFSYSYCDEKEKAILDDNSWVDLEVSCIPQKAWLELLYKR